MCAENIETDFKHILVVLTCSNFSTDQIHELLRSCKGDTFALVVLQVLHSTKSFLCVA